jgi:hypothetical protein
LIDCVDTRPRRAIQWDSFRFWEALAAGCATFNIDLEYYGVILPVMPVNGEHYFGVRFDSAEQTISRLVEDPGLLARVAASGRQWAIEHYAPKVMAERFLDWTH